MTQAPTPGPLSLGAGPYSCIRCDNSTWNDDDICDQCAAEACAPENAIDWSDAPTAPVEASGSEREHGPKCWGKTSASDEMAHCYCGSEDSPQLREAVLKGVGKINGDGWKDTTTEGEVVFVWNAEKPTPYAPGQYPRVGNEGWSASTSQYDFTPATANDVPAILALLSARPVALGRVAQSEEPSAHNGLVAGSNPAATTSPLALGGQQGEEVRQTAMSILQSAVRTFDAEDRTNLDAVLDDLIDALATTSARAEAQDEGAAGEASAYRVRMISNDPAEWVLMHPEKALDFLSRKGWESQPLYAHPSPTPAADADRVREAIADVISHESDWRTALTAMDAAEETPEDGSGKPGYWLHQIKVLDRIVAALKTEGK